MLRLSAITIAVSVASYAAHSSAQNNSPERRVLEEVVVTATKRAGVSVQDLPISITILDSETLRQADINSVTDLTQLSASLIAVEAQSVASTRIGLRGLSTSANNIGFEAAVGVSIDGVARGRTGLALAELPELASVEVLRGPQGTLFGRNTTAGVININTAKPDPEGGGYISAQAGNYNSLEVKGGLSFPINDQWTGRVDGKYRERDGILEDINSDTDVNSIDRTSARGQLLFNGDSSSLRLIADWAEDKSICCGSLFFQQTRNSGAVLAVAALDGRAAYGSADRNDMETALTFAPKNDISEWGLSAEYNKTIGALAFRSVTAYRDWESVAGPDSDLSGADLTQREETAENTVFTQELTLSGETGVVSWLAGAFYLNDEVDLSRIGNTSNRWEFYPDFALSGAAGLQAYGTLPSTPGQPGFTPSLLAALNPALATTYLPPAPSVTNDIDQSTEALALFTHNEFALSDRLKATLGVRYTSEEKDLDYNFTSTDSGSPLEGCRVAAGLASTPLARLGQLLCIPTLNILLDGADQGGIDYDAISGVASLAYHVNQDMMIYGSYSRGFKAGGFNFDRVTITLDDGGGSVEDLEFDEEIVDAYEIGWNSRFADGKVTLNGAVFYQDVQDFQQLNFTGLQFELDQGDFESQGVELDLAVTPIQALTINANYAYTDAQNKDTGVEPNAQPKNVLSMAGTYFLPLGETMMSTFHLNARFQDETRLTRDIYEDNFTTFNARIALMSNDGTWEFALWGQNLTDENRLIAGFTPPFNGAGGTNAMGFVNTPRLYGAELSYAF